MESQDENTASSESLPTTLRESSALVEDANLLSNDLAKEWRFVSEACPRAHWTPDAESSRCEHRGCPVRFGCFGLPGVSLATKQRLRTGSMDVYGSDRRQSLSMLNLRLPETTLSFARRTSSSSTVSTIDSMVQAKSFECDDEASRTSMVPKVPGSDGSMMRTFSNDSQYGFQTEVPTCPPIAVTQRDSREVRSLSPSPAFGPATPNLSNSQSSSFRSSSIESMALGEPAKPRPATATSLLPRSPVKIHRRHHCRRCGSCFCNEHSSNVATLVLSMEDRTDTKVEMDREESERDDKRDSQRTVTPTDVIAQTSPETVAIFDVPPKEAESSLKGILTQNDGGQIPWLTRRPSESPIYQRQFFRGRVCDECYGLCQRARLRMTGLVDSPKSRPSAPTYIQLTNNSYPIFSSSIATATPTIQEEEEEYFVSKRRVMAEKRREHKELLRALCNEPTANRIVAAAAKGEQSDSSLFSFGRGPAIRKCSVYEVVTGMDTGLSSVSAWEKVELERHRERIANAAFSMDSVMLHAKEQLNTATPVRSTTDDLTCSTTSFSPPPSQQQKSIPSSPTRPTSSSTGPQSTMTSPASASVQWTSWLPSSEDDDDIDVVLRRDLSRLASPSGWERRWNSRPSSPHPAFLANLTARREDDRSPLMLSPPPKRTGSASTSVSGRHTPQKSSFSRSNSTNAIFDTGPSRSTYTFRSQAQATHAGNGMHQTLSGRAGATKTQADKQA